MDDYHPVHLHPFIYDNIRYTRYTDVGYPFPLKLSGESEFDTKPHRPSGNRARVWSARPFEGLFERVAPMADSPAKGSPGAETLGRAPPLRLHGASGTVRLRDPPAPRQSCCGELSCLVYAASHPEAPGGIPSLSAKSGGGSTMPFVPDPRMRLSTPSHATAYQVQVL